MCWVTGLMAVLGAPLPSSTRGPCSANFCCVLPTGPRQWLEFFLPAAPLCRGGLGSSGPRLGSGTRREGPAFALVQSDPEANTPASPEPQSPHLGQVSLRSPPALSCFWHPLRQETVVQPQLRGPWRLEVGPRKTSPVLDTSCCPQSSLWELGPGVAEETGHE